MKKLYTISITKSVMEQFQKDCDESGLKYGPEIERILLVHNKNRLLYETNSQRSKDAIVKEAKELISMGKAIIGEVLG